MRKLCGFLLAVTAVAACDSPFEPQMPPGAVQFWPDSTYRAWWQEIAACSGLRDNIDRVRWYYYPGVNIIPRRNAIGYWHPDHKIFFAENWYRADMVVRHEMLHEYLDGDGHPAEYFVDRCGAIVTPP